MPGYLGGGSSSGAGGEIKFPKEFIDPVTKLRVSNPENLIDTDFEYGLQPTKWETVELINNTPSFFSKSGDTTIDGISSITTNSGTREITVKTALEHGLAVGIPIQVTGTKSITADGSYIINSIPDAFTFTYLCKDDQTTTASIEDLYSSIITGEFFQGSQLRISDDAGIVTDGASPISKLTVSTTSTHGFGLNTPFYFLNLNSTISQEFPAANTTTKSFDASNSATAQTFDGSNTLSSLNIDLSNAPVVGGATSSITSTNPTTDAITVSHASTENFAGLPVGTPLYYDVVAGSGFFAANPRGVVFLKTTSGLGTVASAFSVSEVPDGDVIDITGGMDGTFQIANQARTFAGNNVNAETQETVLIVNDTAKEFDGDNSEGLTGTVVGYSGSNVTVESTTTLAWYQGAMVLYETDGTAATNLTNNTTYFIDFFAAQSGTDFYSFTIKDFPNGSVISGISGGSGNQTFKQIGVSIDKDIFHVKDHGYNINDMLRYDSPENGFFTANEQQNFYFVQTRYDQHNFSLTHTLGEIIPLTVSREGTDAGTAIDPTPVTVVGFEAPYTFAVTSGVLPTGLTLDTSTGIVTGSSQEVIDAPGREVVITLTDATGAQATQTHTYQFNQPPELYAFSSSTFTSGGQSGRTGPSLSQVRNGLGNPSWSNDTANLNTSNGIIRWTVPRTATYRIEAAGARGPRNTSYGDRPGYGAYMRGDFNLQQGEEIRILVGQQAPEFGDTCAAPGGGGGSFVTRGNHNSNSDILVIAGGGGGVGTDSGQRQGIGGTTSNNGTASNSNNTAGGTNGNGGARASNSPCSYSWIAGSGGGFFTHGGGPNGNPGTGETGGGFGYIQGGYGGRSNINNQGRSGADGGFGGGGRGSYGAGAGGGYSGGGAGRGMSCSCSTWRGGGGGGSYNSGTNASNSSDSNNGNGYVTITRL